MNINHPAIVDNVGESENFIDYIHKKGLKIVLEISGRYIEARLVGVFRVHPSCEDGPESTSEFVGYSETKEGAIKELAKHCSGVLWSEGYKPHWFFGSYDAPTGMRGTFPRFKFNYENNKRCS